MIKTLATRDKNQVPASLIRDKILTVEDAISKIPGAMKGDCFPLKHTFVDGAYVREITMPKGMLLTSKIHKVTHPYFVLSGDVSVLTEDGIIRIKGPYSGITKAGTKRILYTHKKTVWTTIHITRETDLEKIEEEIIAKNFNEIPIEQEQVKLIEFVKTVTKKRKRGKNVSL